MTDVHVYVRDIRELAKVPENGILSQTLQNDDRTKVILFGFAAGQELSAHTAPFPATLIFLKGEPISSWAVRNNRRRKEPSFTCRQTWNTVSKRRVKSSPSPSRTISNMSIPGWCTGMN